MTKEQNITKALRGWYKKNARVLPWRVGPHDWARGERADPYRVWISEMMLQQTTVATVKERYHDFLERFPTVEALAAASQDDVLEAWAGLGYYSRARNLHKAAVLIAPSGFPKTQPELEALPGIGAYTSAAIASIAFDDPHPVVDGNVERVVSRLYRLDKPPARNKAQIRELAHALTPQKDPGNHAQAMMDLASGICRPRNPQCLICPLREYCAAAHAGDAEAFPVKIAKKPKPERRGSIYVSRQGADWLLERRPETGLLGGTLGWPGSDWREGEPDLLPPVVADWERVGTIRHNFTHFHLDLDVYCATIDEQPISNRLVRIPAKNFNPATLPTVMKKVFVESAPFFREKDPI